MKIGEMRDRITIQKKKEQTGAVINLKGEYEDYKTLWSKVEYFSSKEIYTAKGVDVLISAKFIIRYRKDITPDMRIKFDNEYYEIKGKPRPLNNKKMYLLIVGEMIKHE